MSEPIKTLIFVVVAAVAVAAAYFIDSSGQPVDVQEYVGAALNSDFEVDQPKRLRIIKFDRQTAETRQFEVAAIDGVWSIPSKQDYPADATQQMAKAANALIDRKVLRVQAETAQDHERLGVIDPQSAKLNSSSQGVGTRVIMTDGDDKTLVDMIIGKKVKDSEGQRFVRKTNQDVVYVVEVDPESLSTNFEDWIEDDLLKLSPFDIRRVFINDYSAELSLGMTADGQIAPQISWDRRAEITLGYDNDAAKWQLVDLKKYDRQSKAMVPDSLGADEELNQETLNTLRTALDDLLIVDIARKPAGLSDDLKAGNDFMTNREAFEDLIAKGFSPVPIKPGAPPEILSSEGEVVCTQRDGVEYVLRFGQLQVQTDSAADGDQPAAGDDEAVAEDEKDVAAADPGKAEAPKAPAEEKKPDATEEKNLRRYLFVMARFNEEIIEKPELKELPPLPEGATPSAAATDAASPDPTASEETPAADANEADAAAPATEEPPAADDAEPSPGGDQTAAAEPNEPTDEDSPAEEDEAATEPASADAPADAPSEDAAAPTEEARPADTTPSEDAAEPAQDAAPADASAPADPAAAEREAALAARQQVEEENKRAEDEYKETVEAGKKRVAELNERFGDWYYVISNDVYKQMHLGRAQVIKKKEAAEGAKGAADANPLPGLPNLPGAAAAPAAEPSADSTEPADEAAAAEPAADAPAE